MAGDWIKMRNDLAEDPAVIGIAALTGTDEFSVIGRLQTLWSWADRQSRDGHADYVTSAWLNRKVQCDGFAEAMIKVGWLITDETGITIPNFGEHNGESAKTRALGKNRKQKQRATPDVTHESPDASRSERDKSVTREEKRREEIKEEISATPPPSRGEGRFPEFWDSWPKTDRKQDRKKCLEKWHRKACDAIADAILSHVKAMRLTRKWLEGFEPAPLTYLNGERWNDGIGDERPPPPPRETDYQRSMRERYEEAAPMVAAKAPGTLKPNPMDLLDEITKSHTARIAD